VARTTWPEEIKKWDHLDGLRFSVVVGTAAERRMALSTDADVYIINRENVPWLINESGFPFDYDMVVIDELSSFKSWQSKRFKALMKVRPSVKRIVGLTGTPSSNGLMDLFAEFKVLDMGHRLGRFIGQYREAYFKPDRMNGPIVYTYKLQNGAEDAIYKKISDITISMKATDHLNMPELISSEYRVYLNDKEMKKYEELKTELVMQLPEKEITAANAASLSGKLSQLANGAIYDDEGGVNAFHERKIDALEDLIEAANGKPVLVAYWFKHDLARITERMDQLKVNYEKLDSDESIRKWNSGKLQVGLIHPASAGHGLNLQSGGNCLVWFGLTWSLELYQQTVARLWRQGQTSGTVSVIHIVTDGTVDERILKALEAKDSTQAALIDAVKAEVVHSG
jgi:SNF2 family DNA or RNA helicase